MIIGHAIIGAEVYISAGIRYVAKELKEQKPEHLIAVPLYLETFYRKIWANLKNQGKEKLVKELKEMVDAEYSSGRQTALTDEELETMLSQINKERFVYVD